jgi:hypothetical protein
MAGPRTEGYRVASTDKVALKTVKWFGQSALGAKGFADSDDKDCVW